MEIGNEMGVPDFVHGTNTGSLCTAWTSPIGQNIQMRVPNVAHQTPYLYPDCEWALHGCTRAAHNDSPKTECSAIRG